MLSPGGLTLLLVKATVPMSSLPELAIEMLLLDMTNGPNITVLVVGTNTMLPTALTWNTPEVS